MGIFSSNVIYCAFTMEYGLDASYFESLAVLPVPGPFSESCCALFSVLVDPSLYVVVPIPIPIAFDIVSYEPVPFRYNEILYSSIPDYALWGHKNPP